MDRTVKAQARADLVKILLAGARNGCQIPGGWIKCKGAGIKGAKISKNFSSPRKRSLVSCQTEGKLFFFLRQGRPWVVFALAFHHCGPGSNPGPDVIRCVDLGIGSCPFSESFFSSVLVFVQPQKPAPQILISILMYMDTHIHHHGDLFLYGVKNSLTDVRMALY